MKNVIAAIWCIPNWNRWEHRSKNRKLLSPFALQYSLLGAVVPTQPAAEWNETYERHSPPHASLNTLIILNYEHVHHANGFPLPSLLQVIYALNTKNDEHEAAIATLKEAHEEEVQQILSETREKILQVFTLYFRSVSPSWLTFKSAL